VDSKKMLIRKRIVSSIAKRGTQLQGQNTTKPDPGLNIKSIKEEDEDENEDDAKSEKSVKSVVEQNENIDDNKSDSSSQPKQASKLKPLIRLNP
jgi:transcription termination factor NusB